MWNLVQPDASRLDVMNFLNEAAIKHPQATSFASGRPAEAAFQLESWLGRIPEFIEHFAEKKGVKLSSAYNMIGQYGKTNGLINDLIAAQLLNDEGIVCREDDVIVTAGCQEAMALCTTSLCLESDDVLLVRNPTYIGITGVADLYGIKLASISAEENGTFAQSLKVAVQALQTGGKTPKALYLTPEFDNPTGTVLSVEERKEIIAFCFANGVAILEDNPYGMFRFEGSRSPSMFELDDLGCVIYLGTYSKTLCPSVRVGFIATGQQFFGSAEKRRVLVERLSVAKSYLTVNTAQINQAMVGGVLLAENNTLRSLIQPAFSQYRDCRQAMLDGLQEEYSDVSDKVTWNRPEGGFFLTVSLPFEFGRAEFKICAEQYGVIMMPLSFFAFDESCNSTARLAYSYIQPEQIRLGVKQFAKFVRDRISP